MKKILLLASFASLFVLGANAQPQTTPSVDPNAPVMKFETDTMNFGTVTQGTIVERDYKFTNTGKTPLVITSASGSCHCTVPSYSTEPIAPGKSGVIHVRFDSNGKMGYQDKTATINSNNKDGTVIIHLRGTVTTAPAAPAPGAPDPSRGGAPTNGGN
ncbi:MAG: DUF1573 domain-containing protein [Bacteroidetes bacterium]|nr:DUF1573 domain-containing protein [Bacteroidota bacterium]